MKKSFSLWSDTGIVYPSPIQRISNIKYWIKDRPWYRQFEFDNLSPSISVANSSQIKVITQSGKVDINSFVGYMGGYEELILGVI